MNTQWSSKDRTGVLLPLSCLPSRDGVGDFGHAAYQFIHLLKKMKMNVWQFLPLNALGYGNSPYQTYSSFAMDELYLSLEDLLSKGYLQKQSLFNYRKNYQKQKAFWGKKERVDFDWLRKEKLKLLQEASENFYDKLEAKKYRDLAFFNFLKEEAWILEYAIFWSAKQVNHRSCWLDWNDDFKTDLRQLPFSKIEEQSSLKNYLQCLEAKLADVETKAQVKLLDLVKFQLFAQYYLQKQFLELKAFANEKGIRLVGDLPIYLGIDSAELFYHSEEFLLEADGSPSFVAGVPPDYFSPTGQRWGNPLYDWKKMQENDFSFWKKRFAYQFKCFDEVRVDHFRAFDTYYKIPASCPDATEGEWALAPGYALFDSLQAYFGHFEILAEDLGDLRPEVLELRDHYQFRGMQILQFDFEKNTDRRNSVLYTGTHDNESLKQWFQSLDLETQEKYRQHLHSYGASRSLPKALLAYTLDSQADFCILPYADLLFLGKEARLNFPGKLISENWTWKVMQYRPLNAKIRSIRRLVQKFRG